MAGTASPRDTAGPERVRLRRGLDLPLPGAPARRLEDAAPLASVGLLGDDFPRLRPSLQVALGDRVRLGQLLFSDVRRPELRFTAPAAGVVSAIGRGERRELVSLEISVEGDERLEWDTRRAADPDASRESVVELLLESGAWLALRARPFGEIADPARPPHALFVRAMDTNPLAPDASLVLAERPQDLRSGLAALAKLTDGPLFVCTDPAAAASIPTLDGVRRVVFEGPHPAGLVGTHVHRMFPVDARRHVWHLGYQDVLAIGALLRTGCLDPRRVIALAGPMVREPRLLRTRVAASTDELVRGELLPGACRIVSGSLLSGRRAASAGRFLGRYHEQICAIPEVAESEPPAWLVPGALGSRRLPPWRRRRQWTSAVHGTRRAFLPLDLFERVLPLRLPIGLLLRALAAGDSEAALELGALELEAEDLALCSFLCPSKLEYGALLQAVHAELSQRG